MTKEEQEQLALEIDHIFESGATGMRVYEMVKNFIDSRNAVNKISFNPMLADVNPLKDFLLGLRFAEHPEIRKEAQRLLGIYFC
jgi:hypothetical protein